MIETWGPFYYYLLLEEDRYRGVLAKAHTAAYLGASKLLTMLTREETNCEIVILV